MCIRRTASKLAFATLALSACAAPRQLTTGAYLETLPNTILFSSKELRLYPEHRFAYYQHTDMVGAGKHGTGTYELLGRTLLLHFNGQPAEPATETEQRPLPTNTHAWRFVVTTTNHHGISLPLAGATLTVFDEAGGEMKTIACDTAGRAEVPALSSIQARSVLISMIGFEPWKQRLSETSTAYDIALRPNFGQAYPEGTTLEFGVLKHGAGRLVLREGKSTISMVVQQ